MVHRWIEPNARMVAMCGIALLLLLTGLALRDSALSRWSYDLAQWLAAPVLSSTDSPVVLIYLDLESYQRENQPLDKAWSRALHAQLLQRLTRARARAVVFDIVFDGPGKDAAADAALKEAIKTNGHVVLAAELESSSREAQVRLRNASVVFPWQSLHEAAAGCGLANCAIDEDFVVRRYFPGRLSLGQPSLTWATARMLELPVTRGDPLGKEERWLRYYGRPLYLPSVNYSTALDSQAINDSFFADKIVFIGARPMTGGFGDRRDEFRNPLSSWEDRDVLMPAVEVHATQMLNLLRHDWLRRLSRPAEAWLLALCAAGLSVGIFQLRPLPATGMAAAAEAVVLGAVIWVFQPQGVWFPWAITAGVQVPGALLGSITFHSLEWYRARRRLEAARREAEAKIREQAALIDKAQDAILVQNLSGQIVYGNPSAERLYGWSVSELSREGVIQQLFAPVAGKLAAVRSAVMEKGEWLGELEQATRAGNKLIVESRWTLIRDEGGCPKSILLINTDITEKKRLEAQFFRAQRLDTIGSLASGMAHDLNNALSPVLMGIQLIGRKPQDDETRRMLVVMEANTQRGADMVRQVLTFSRGSEAGQEPVNVGRLVREMENIVRQTLPKSIAVATFVANDLWPVLGNPTELHQVLLNLCINARDAMPEGGELNLAADNVTLSVEEAQEIPEAKAGDYVVVIVSDTGAGIAPEVLPRIFEPFFTTKTPDKGTGLGLATIARIVKNHHGCIRVVSEVGTGATFEVYFPRMLKAVPLTSLTGEAAKPLALGNGEFILFVDDDHSVREMIVTTLSEHGYRVISAGDGAQALAMLAEHAKDIRLVLTDLDMPAMDGLTLAATVRFRFPTLPVVLMSGELDSQYSPHAANLPLLPKPFRLEQLLKTIRKEICRQPSLG